MWASHKPKNTHKGTNNKVDESRDKYLFKFFLETNKMERINSGPCSWRAIFKRNLRLMIARFLCIHGLEPFLPRSFASLTHPASRMTHQTERTVYDIDHLLLPYFIYTKPHYHCKLYPSHLSLICPTKTSEC